MSNKGEERRPLDGIRVVELGIAIAGPVACRNLAHFGAEVIKIESRDNPDTSRTFGCGWLSQEQYGREVWMDTSPNVDDNSAGKRVVGLNLKTPEGMEAAKRLIDKSDIFVTNFTPRALKSLGLTYEQVREIRPDIIYLHASGYGATSGPYTNYVAWGKNQVALTGIDELTGWPDRPPAGINGIAYADQSNGLYGFVSILIALDYRDRTGEGIAIDLSQFEATVAMLGPQLMDYAVTGRCPQRTGSRLPWTAPQGVYPSRGTERWVAITAAGEQEWQSLCEVVEHPEWTEDRRFRTVRERLAHHDELDTLIGNWTSQYTNEEVAEWLQLAGVPAAPVMDYAALALDPHLQSRGFWYLGDSKRFGKDFFTGLPIRLSETPGYVKHAGPALGEDNEYVLNELAGFSLAQIDQMVKTGAVQPMAAPDLKLERPYARWLRPLTPLMPWNEPPVPKPSLTNMVRPKPVEPVKAIREDQGMLSGYRVLDLSGAEGAYATKLMADLGAEVIKIEPPKGDATRSLPPFAGEVGGSETSLWFAYMNTNKRSLTLDLASPEGKRLFGELAKGADIVFETFAPGYLSTLGIGYPELSKLNPGLVWVALTPFGQTGPRRDWKGSDLVTWASSGLLYCCGDIDRPPANPGGYASLSYFYACLDGVAGAMLGLQARRLFGCGQMIDISLQEAAIAPQGAVPTFLEDFIQRMRTGTARPATAPNSLVQTSDGHAAVLNQLPRHWDIFAKWVNEVTGIEEVLAPEYRVRRYRLEVFKLIDEWTESLTRRYTKQALMEEGQGRGLGITPSNTVADLSHDPHLEARGFWAEMSHPVLGRLRMAGAPFRVSTRGWKAGAPPLLGQDNQAIFCGELGLTKADLTKLHTMGVV